MSSQTSVPLGYAQEAIAPITTIVMSASPNFENIVAFAESDLAPDYDLLAEEDLELILADMQFPS